MLKNASESIKIQLRCPRMPQEFAGIRGQNFEQFKTFELNSRKTYELQELTTDCANQVRSSRTEYDSATNPNICQFVGFGACVE